MPSMTFRTKQKHRWQFDAIGTRWVIETYSPIDGVKDLILDRIEQFERVYSRFRDDSLVSDASNQSGVFVFPPDVKEFIAFYRHLYDVTHGAVSPLVGDALVAAGYDKRYSLRPRSAVKIPAWDEVMTWRDNEVTTTRPLVLDFGAAGKGYLVDLIAGMIEKDGVKEYVIDASGDIRMRGSQEVIGLENPYDAKSVLGTIQVQDASLCASATNRRAWGDWHHIIDPRTAAPVRDVVATWVVAPTTLIADGLATALFFVSADELTQWKFSYLRLFTDGRVERSDNFMGELYI